MNALNDILNNIIVKKPFRNLDKNISLLLVHIQVIISTDDLFKPFRKILKHTKEFRKSYLPAMPHDDDYELFKNFQNIKPIRMNYKGQIIKEDFGKLKAFQ